TCSTAGDLYFNDVDDTIKICNGTAWEALDGGGGGDLDSTYDADSDKILNVDDATNDLHFRLSAGSQVVFDMATTTAPTVDMANINNSGASQGTVTDAVDGLSIDFVSASDAAVDTNAGAHITIIDSGDSGDFISGLQVTAGTASAGTQYGISIDTITGGGGTETALNIGNGWDTGISLGTGLTTGISVASGGIAVNGGNITSTGTLTIDATSAVVLGTGTNGFRVDETWSDSTSGFTGTARPVRKVTLVPEYAGAVLTPDTSSNTGTMTSDFCSSTQNVNEASTPTDAAPCDLDLTEEHNYYTWTSNQATQDYDIWVRWQIPTDFSNFTGLTDTVQAYGWRTGTSEAVQISMFDNNGTADATDANVATTNTQWTLNDIDDAPGGTYAQGGYITFKIHMVNSTANNDAKVGEIIIKYNAKL
ncbi:MAG: hypothetical protein US53_C0015G0009, partial [Candidatus Woesebacteria bacterium GW2011_GWA1_37_7]